MCSADGVCVLLQQQRHIFTGSITFFDALVLPVYCRHQIVAVYREMLTLHDGLVDARCIRREIHKRLNSAITIKVVVDESGKITGFLIRYMRIAIGHSHLVSAKLLLPVRFFIIGRLRKMIFGQTGGNEVHNIGDRN